MKKKIIISIAEKLIETNRLLIKSALENGNVSDGCKIKIDDMVKNVALMSENLEDVESQLNVIKQIVDLNNEMTQGIILFQQQDKEILEYCRKNKLYTAELLTPRFASKIS